MKKNAIQIKVAFVILFLTLFFSCKKERITKDHPEFIGTWTEKTDVNEYRKLQIDNDGSGIFYECTKGTFADCAETRFRKWRVKNNHIYYGTTKDLGKIIQYPTISTFDILVGSNDTIKTGAIYMILNYSYYTKQ